MALRNVVESVCEINHTDIPSNDPVEQVSENYYIVRTNSKIDLSQLEYLLKAELEKREITEDFEYGVYDCKNDRMVYGNLVSFSDDEVSEAKGDFPKLQKQDYYFGVYFPDKARNPLWGFDIWKFTTLLTLFVIVFFAYAMFEILRQKKLSAIQRDFVNNITHEFKTPISTLKVAASALENLTSGDESRLSRYAEIISSESQRLEKQVKQLLDSAVMENTRKIKVRKMDPAPVLQNIVNVFRSEHTEMKFQLEISGEGTDIKANDSLLESIFYNLIDNAVKYGGDKVRIAMQKKGHDLQIDIQDNGPGIPEKDQLRIFRKFYRVSQGDRHDVKGFGLGLFVVKNAVSLLKGKITVNCQKGCLFIVKIPLA